MKGFRELFEVEERESARLVAELQEHKSTWPEVERQYNAIDQECVELARELMPLHFAASPLRFECEARLRGARMRRDGIRATFQRKKNELQDRIASLSREEITDFHADSLDRARHLSQSYQFRRLRSETNLWDDKTTVIVESNIDALEVARARILAGIKELREMELRPLADVRKKIQELAIEFAGFRFGEMKREEVSPRVADDMRPRSPSIAAGNEKLNALSARLTALEGR